MKITSEYTKSAKVFWRMFDPGDGVRLIGHKEGFLAPGASADVVHPSGKFQLELKEDSLHGKVIAAGGLIYRNDGPPVRIMDSGGVPQRYPGHEAREAEGPEGGDEHTVEGEIVIVDGFPGPGPGARTGTHIVVRLN